MSSTTAPSRRADAQRNRDRLLAVAGEAFAAGDAPALETIAKDAGVGIGTLYRHFPTREALVEAVYRSELEAVCASADELRGSAEPDVALRSWMDRYAVFVRTKRGMVDSLPAILGAGAGSETRSRIVAAMNGLLEAGTDAGLLRDDVAADDVVVAMLGACLATQAKGQQAQTARVLDLLMDAVRLR